MKKRKKVNRNKRKKLGIKLVVRKQKLKQGARLRKVLVGLNEGMTIQKIHYYTGIAEKNIRKIMLANPEEITFLMLNRKN